MSLPVHAAYEQLARKAKASHTEGRSSRDITSEDVDSARLYSYAFRVHTIGAYHATRLAIEALQANDPLAATELRRASETLEDLANQGMEPVPNDFRAVVFTFHRYDRGVRRVMDALERAARASLDKQIERIGNRFGQIISQITTTSGIYLTHDTEAPEQAGFIVPNLGITIVPLVYGDHHSWNLAFLSEEHLDVPWHRHHEGVEIHLGYEPLNGYMILGDAKSPVTEGYALPIPSMTRHGWGNISGQVHHVPFIFGSLKQAGWGVFLDVEAQPLELEQFKTVDRTDWQMNHAVYLNRQIKSLANQIGCRRQVLVPAAVMDRNGTGGLELSLSRANPSGFTYPLDDFRCVSVVSGQGQLQIGPARTRVRHHDHFGIPKGMTATVSQVGDDPLVLLDALIKRP